MKNQFSLIFLVMLLLTACSSGTLNIQPSTTPLVKETIVPIATNTILPTATNTIIPTDIPAPTKIIPTDTSVPPTLEPCSSPAKLVSPENDAKLDTLIPIFKWETGNDPDAKMSDLYIVRTEQKLANKGHDRYIGGGNKIGITEVNMIPFFGQLQPATKYFWHVQLKCRKSGGEAPFSETWSFTTGNKGTILPAPTLVDNKTADGEVTFEWNKVEGAVEYYIEVDGMFSNTTQDLTFKSKLPAGKSYKWRVTARNDYSWGKASPFKQFSIP